MTAVDTVTGEVVDQDEPTLAELEATIERGLESFVEVGSALLAIKAGRRYREAGYSSFEDYCMRRWEISRGYGYRLVLAAATVEGLQRQLSPMGDTPLPTSERQTRPLSRLPEDERAHAWTDAVEQAEAEGRAPTARDVEDAVDRRRPAKTTVTERITETRQTVTEPVPETHDSAPADEREEAGAPSPDASASDRDEDAISRGIERAFDAGLTYRVAVTKAIGRAQDLVQLDVDRAVATAGESADGHRLTVQSIHAWCERYLQRSRPSHLRSVR